MLKSGIIKIVKERENKSSQKVKNYELRKNGKIR